MYKNICKILPQPSYILFKPTENNPKVYMYEHSKDNKMGQQEVYNFLKEHKGKWFTSKEISKETGVSIGSVTMSLKKLRKSQLIKYKNTGKRNEYHYMYK